jgi:CheY-like chemotaxis protein/nitrogen-specific signal transduction histidine kinase
MAKMNTELIRSNIELKRLSEMKTNFLSITSHELKTPLTSIMGYSDIIVDNMKERIDEGVFRMIESINRAAGRLNKVINNILDVTRIDQKKLRLKPETFQLSGAVNDSVEEFAQLAAQRGISFKCFFSDNLPEFYGDRSRMQQVFANLFTNAIKFSPDGSVVEVSLAADGSDRFHITIRDHGIGIDANDQRHIFDPFSEIGEISKHSTDQMKFKGGGTGLGLSIAKGIVERHGGRIWVESEGVRPGAFPGSAFHIILPVRSEIGRDDLEKEPAIPAQSAVSVQKQKIKEGKPSLLLIDTDHEAVEVARMVLENAFDIITAPTGEMGLSLAFRHRPAMILLDVSLPGLDGFRVCSILRTQEETRGTPVVFLSSTTRKEEIEKCFACGADDFIVKPFSGRELMDKIWQLLMKKKAEAVQC